MAKAIMIQGTASGVGKTILTLALCRIFKEDGYKVAPFKAQNMTSNTCFVNDGEEIAISQWLQAAAAGVAPNASMNPILLKPCDGGTQVIVNGRPFDTINAYNFKELKAKLVPILMEAYEDLAKKYDIIVIEGAGSPVELNLSQDDIVNMGMAKRAKAQVLLVSNIDRGGIFASLYGTIKLLNEQERPYVKATIVNKFMGNVSLFGDGIEILEKITEVPVAGVVPGFKINLPEEDGLFGDASEVVKNDYEKQFSGIAEVVRKSMNMKMIYEILNKAI